MLDVHTTTLGDLRRIAEEQGQRGTVAIGEAGGGRVAAWQNASRTGKAIGGRPNKALLERENRLAAQMVARLHEGLPPVVRRTADARYQALVKILSEQALASVRATGRVQWPHSIEQELKVLGWKDGDPRLERIGTMEGAKRQIEDLARRFIVDGAHKQREKDQRKTALDWHGHYSA